MCTVQVKEMRSMTGMACSCIGVAMPVLLRQLKLENEKVLVPDRASMNLSALCTDDFGARANELQKWMVCRHQKDGQMSLARMTAFEVVQRTQQMRL